MSWLRNQKIGTRLLASFLMMAALLAYVGYTGIENLRIANGSVEEMYKDRLVPASEIGTAHARLNHFRLTQQETAQTVDKPELFREFTQKGEADLRQVEVSFEVEAQNLGDANEHSVVSQCRDQLARVRAYQSQLMRILLDGSQDAAARKRAAEEFLLDPTVRAAAHDAEASLAQLSEIQTAAGSDLHHHTSANYQETRTRFMWIVGASVLLAILLGLGQTWSITGPIQGVVRLLDRVAGGDLTETVVIDREDEVGAILKASSEMMKSLRKMIGDAKSGSNVLASATTEINASSRRAVETSQGQLSAVQETMTSSTELQETARVAGDRALQIQTGLGQTVDSGQAIRHQLGDATGLMGRAREELAVIVTSIQELANRNQQIGEIIESVGDVADQTQLLAVNAAIEAAKAGEVGRGFGVVATEMKSLAEQSKKSAQRIRGIVGDVQRATADSVRLVETGQVRMQQALEPVIAILPKVEQLTVQIEDSGQAGRQIVAIINQQGVGIEQINQAMKAIQAGVQEGLAQSQQVERAAETLASLAGKLNDSVSAYRV